MIIHKNFTGPIQFLPVNVWGQATQVVEFKSEICLSPLPQTHPTHTWQLLQGVLQIMTRNSKFDPFH